MGRTPCTKPPATGWLWLDNRLVSYLPSMTGPALKVYLALAKHADADRACFPGLARIAEMTGLTKRTARRAIKALVDAKLIKRTKRVTRCGDSDTNLYQLLPVKDRGGGVTPDPTWGHVGPQGGVTLDRGVGSRLTPKQDPLNKNQRKREPPKAPKGETEATTFPKELETPEFRAAWNEWEEHRRELRKRLTPGTRRKQLETCAKWGAERAVRAIEASIEAGWQGLFEPKQGQQNGEGEAPAYGILPDF